MTSQNKQTPGFKYTKRKPCFPECKDRICGSCKSLFVVDPNDRFAFDNYGHGCFENGEGHSKKQKACEKFKCDFQDPDGTCRPLPIIPREVI